jgi:hypothetical protein
MNQQLANILHNMYQFSIGLNKTIFRWNLAPKGLKILAGTDSSGIVTWHGRKYYVTYDWQSSAIVIENY